MVQVALFKAFTAKQNIIDDSKLIRELNKALDQTEKAIKKEFAKSVKDWGTPVKFETFQKGVVPQKFVQDIALQIGTTNQIYRYVSDGTKPHVIRPKRAKVLRFRTGGKSKTTVGRIPSRKGSPGDNPVSAREVHHPGTKAREYEKRIAKKMKPVFNKNIKAAIEAATKGK